MNELLLSLIDHMRWADAIVAESLQRHATPDREAARLFAHIASVEHLWFARIEGAAGGARRLAGGDDASPRSGARGGTRGSLPGGWSTARTQSSWLGASHTATAPDATSAAA